MVTINENPYETSIVEAPGAFTPKQEKTKLRNMWSQKTREMQNTGGPCNLHGDTIASSGRDKKHEQFQQSCDVK